MEVEGIDGLSNMVGGDARVPVKALGRDEFLHLLTVQLRYQDPLEPMGNTEMVAQLAQFSSLEQLENMNANLASSVDLDLILTQVLNNTAAAGLIGKSVIAGGDVVNLGSADPVSVHFDLSSYANRVSVTISDKSGTVVRTLEEVDVEGGRGEIAWDGKDSEGHDLADGDYTFEVHAYDADGEPIEVSPLIMGEVMGVKYEDGKALLTVDGVEVAISEVLEIYAGSQVD